MDMDMEWRVNYLLGGMKGYYTESEGGQEE